MNNSLVKSTIIWLVTEQHGVIARIPFGNIVDRFSVDQMLKLQKEGILILRTSSYIVEKKIPKDKRKQLIDCSYYDSIINQALSLI